MRHTYAMKIQLYCLCILKNSNISYHTKTTLEVLFLSNLINLYQSMECQIGKSLYLNNEYKKNSKKREKCIGEESSPIY